VSADGTAHPDRWLEDATASYHEVGLVPRDMMDVVRQPRILVILLIPISAAVSGIRSIRPLRLERQDEQRILQHLAPGVLHAPLGCFRFHPGLLVLHLLDEAGVLPVTEFESGDSTYVASRQLKPIWSAGALTCGVGLQTLYPLDEAGEVFSDKPCQLNSNSNREFEWDKLSQLYRRVEDATVRAVGVTAGWDNLHASSIDSPDPVILILRSVRSVGACALTAQGDKVLEESRIRPVRSENNTQPVESQSTGKSPMTRSPCSSTRVQPSSSPDQSGLSLSSACLSWSEADDRQPNPDQSNSLLPVRLASPMNFYKEWIQQGKVPPDRTPSVPVNTQSNRPVRVELDVGDVKDELPASAVGLQAESVPVDSTGSNPEDRGEFPSVSPIGLASNFQLMRPMADGISAPISQAGEPVSCKVRANTGKSASNRDWRPDDDRSVYLPRDEAIDNDVRVAQTSGDVLVSHNGVPVASESYNDVRTINKRCPYHQH